MATEEISLADRRLWSQIRITAALRIRILSLYPSIPQRLSYVAHDQPSMIRTKYPEAPIGYIYTTGKPNLYNSGSDHTEIILELGHYAKPIEREISLAETVLGAALINTILKYHHSTMVC